MGPLVDESTVRANAAELSRLNARIGETLAHRSSSASGRLAWETACATFHARYDDLFFPGGMARWEAFLSRQDEGMAAALLFLEVDPVFFRSGYLKEAIWQKLKQHLLSERERDRLDAVARQYLDAPLRREFWAMARYVRLRGSSSFWREMERLASQQERLRPAIRAGWLLLVLRNEPVRRLLGRQLADAGRQGVASSSLDLWMHARQA